MHQIRFRRFTAAFLAAAAAFGMSAPAFAEYDDFEEITSHVSTAVSQRLSVTRPSGNVSASDAYYYLTGGSNPDEILTMNGEPVAGRGVFGSWGVYAALEPGENVFRFQNGADEAAVVITRGGAETIARTGAISQQTPFHDLALYAGDEVLVSCVAPAGGKVTASVGGQKIGLVQKAAAADGVPAAFEGVYTMPSVSGTQKIGPVTYSLTHGGEVSTYVSEGAFYAVGKGDTLLVEMKDTSSTLFEEDSTLSGFVTTAKKGAVDYVAEISGGMYRLGMGGWVQQSAARPLTDGGGYKNMVSDVRYDADAGGETWIFKGTGKPIFDAYQNDEKLYLKFYHTSGIRSVPTKGSKLFGDVRVEEQNGATTLEFMRTGARRLWGYVVEYDDSGDTVLYCKYAPRLSAGNKPLENITIAVDPGHGGADTGAPGIPTENGPMEKDINLDSALAVKKRLEKLGATVIMTREDDHFESLSDRMWVSQQARADFFIALHSNAMVGNGLKPHGVEVYYYEDIAKSFAQTMLGHVSGGTGRDARRAAYSNFKVTLCTYAPAILLEMGYVTNPAEYDSLCSRRGIFQMANSVADGLLDYLS